MNINGNSRIWILITARNERLNGRIQKCIWTKLLQLSCVLIKASCWNEDEEDALSPHTASIRTDQEENLSLWSPEKMLIRSREEWDGSRMSWKNGQHDHLVLGRKEATANRALDRSCWSVKLHKKNNNNKSFWEFSAVTQMPAQSEVLHSGFFCCSNRLFTYVAVIKMHCWQFGSIETIWLELIYNRP